MHEFRLQRTSRGARGASSSSVLTVLAATALVLAGCGLMLDEEALLDRAETAMSANDYRAAMIDLKAILQRNPEFAEARAALGHAHLGLGEPFAAEKEFDRAIDYGVDPRTLIVARGQAMLGQEDYLRLLRDIDPGLVDDPSDQRRILLMRADAMSGLGRLPEARELYMQVLEAEPENAMAYLGLAATYIKGEELDRAVQLLDRSVEVAPDLVAGRLARGTFRFGQRELDAARSDLSVAARFARDGDEKAALELSLSSLVDVELLSGNVDAASDFAEELTAFSPASILARYAEARVAYAAGNLEAASILLQGILSDVPEFREAYFLLGAISRDQGNLAQAEMYLASTVASQPGNVEARRMLADVQVRQRRIPTVPDEMDSMLPRPSVDEEELFDASVARLQLGRIREAVDLLEDSTADAPANDERILDLAAVYLAAGDTENARAVLDRVPGGTDSEPRRVIIDALVTQRTNGVNAAIARARAGLEEDADNPRLLVLHGALLEASGDANAARQSFDAALAADSSSVAARLGLARLDIASREFGAARLLLRQALALEPGNMLAMMTMVRLADSAGDRALAMNWLEKARGTDPFALAPRLELVPRLLSQGRVGDAHRVASEAMEISTDNPRVLNNMGVVNLAAGNSAAAEPVLAQAVQLVPDNPAYSYNYARALVANGKGQAALDLLEQTHARVPEHVAVATTLAMLRVRSGNAVGALAIVQDLQERFPDRAAGYVLQGDIQAEREKFAAAAAAYDTALALEPRADIARRAYRLRVQSRHADPYEPLVSYLAVVPDDVPARAFLAQAYHVDEELSLAAAEYRALLEIDPRNVLALNNLANILSGKEPDEALRLAETAHRLVPDNGAVADTYGWLLYEEGNFGEAVDALRVASNALPDNPRISYRFGAALVRYGLRDEARMVLRELIASEDSFADRQSAEELLEQLSVAN